MNWPNDVLDLFRKWIQFTHKEFELSWKIFPILSIALFFCMDWKTGWAMADYKSFFWMTLLRIPGLWGLCDADHSKHNCHLRQKTHGICHWVFKIIPHCQFDVSFDRLENDAKYFNGSSNSDIVIKWECRNYKKSKFLSYY